MQSLTKKDKQIPFGSLILDACRRFILKTLLPLTPLCLILYFLLYSANKDISGEYLGSNPITGAVKLSLDENNKKLSGTLVLKESLPLKITYGQMLDDSRFELLFKLPVLSRQQTINNLSFIGAHHATPLCGINQFGNIAQGDYIEGIFNNGSANIALKLRRNTTKNLFLKHWHTWTSWWHP